MHIFGRQVIWDRIIYSSGDYLDAIQKFDALSFLSSNEDRHVNGQNMKNTNKITAPTIPNLTYFIGLLCIFPKS